MTPNMPSVSKPPRYLVLLGNDGKRKSWDAPDVDFAGYPANLKA